MRPAIKLLGTQSNHMGRFSKERGYFSDFSVIPFLHISPVPPRQLTPISVPVSGSALPAEHHSPVTTKGKMVQTDRGRARLGFRKELFPGNVVKPLHRLSRENGDSSFLSGWGLEPPALVEGVPAQGWGL